MSVDEVIARHLRVPHPAADAAPPGITLGDICDVCRCAWPCDVGILADELAAAQAASARFRAVVDFVYPDDMTPAGKRMFDSIEYPPGDFG